MQKIHVLTQKEEIDSNKITHCTVVIIDVLLATSTIAVCLHHGAKEVIPVFDEEEAFKVARSLPGDSYVLAGEKGGHTIEGFLNPDPISLLELNLTDKTLILCTTNGTVGIRKSMMAKTVYSSSFLNGSTVAKQIQKNRDDSSVLIVCAGSDNRFSMEDFLGAGYLISELLKENEQTWALSDSAEAAYQLYKYRVPYLQQDLQKSSTGILLTKLGYKEAIPYVAQSGLLPVVPCLVENNLVMKDIINEVNVKK
ncbi:2-phosphosulfolactate phosphatase [Aneurinibacillus terranovensis]|uniref:2-phosphosulfolactate phosphatase n=1 Tax=Aneurinibacillus terranovensis TaxID=278991 RepID=UPI0004019BCF|nr:2-phosphosulfolactate phosphatase [Aneurinibacillus terranovensis]